MRPWTRRSFLAASALAASCAQPAAAKPNILWITCEDLSPVMGCYGDPDAYTPNIDALAKEGVRYTNAFSTAPVCSPSRSCLFTGIPATAMGSMHLRGIVPMPKGVRGYPAHLREAGYYCSNNVKEDYNFQTPADSWDESSAKAHWRKRGAGQPFFAIFNIMDTHQSRVRYSQEEFEKRRDSLPPEGRQDPAKVRVPPYYPDTEGVRLNLAILHTQTSIMDAKVGAILRELQEDGLDEETIVFFYSDHGSGLPRGKRWLHDSGTRVPLVIRFPEKFRHLAPGAPGSTEERLVNFEDFGPTALSLAGVAKPTVMTGVPFLGAHAEKARSEVFTARDRVDENFDCSRAVFDGRYRYIRNFQPHRPRMQHTAYSVTGIIRQEVERLAAEGKLSGDAAWLAAPTVPVEELYDVREDPFELKNLAGSAEHAERRERMWQAVRQWMLAMHDTGLLPEDEMVRRAGDGSPMDAPREGFPFERVLDTASMVGTGAAQLEPLRALLKDEEPVVRYWAATGLLALGDAAKPALVELRGALQDEAASVRIAAAEAVAKLESSKEALEVLAREVRDGDARVALQAAVALWYLDQRARPAIAAMHEALGRKAAPKDQNDYREWTLRKTLARLGEAVEPARFTP